MNKTLRLTLKKKWFDMILSGKKKEEYREIKPYWTKRLLCRKKHYSSILFVNGYAKNADQFEIEYKGLSSSIGVVEWGAPAGVPVYILELGEIINTNNLH